MNNNKKLNLTDIAVHVLVLLIMFAFAVLSVRLFTASIIINRIGINNSFTQFVMKGTDFEKSVESDKKSSTEDSSKVSHTTIDWEKEYPFTSDSGENIMIPVDNRIKPAYERIQENFKEKLKKKTDVVDKFTTKEMLFYMPMTSFATKYNKILGWEISEVNGYNNIYYLGDGYYGHGNNAVDTQKHIKSISRFNDTLTSQNIPLVYIAAPSKTCVEDTEYYGTIDFSNQNTDSLIKGLKERDIEYIDLRKQMKKDYKSHHEAFYKTDLHWRAETGLWAAGVVSDYLNKQHDFDIDRTLLDPSRFDSRVFEKRMLGSQGKKLTLAMVDPEDFILLYPKYDNKFRFKIPSINIDKTGTIDIMYDYKHITGDFDYENKMAYSTFLYSGRPLTNIENKKTDSDKKVLIICDSFGRSFVPFFALGVKNLDVIDLRQFTGSLETYVLSQKKQYDCVMVLYNPGAISFTTEGQALFDFR